MVVGRSLSGGLDFITNVKRLNVALTCPEDMLFIIGDRECNVDAKEDREELVAENAHFNDEGKVINTSQSWANNLDKLFTWYRSRRISYTAIPANSLEQADYVNLELAEEFRKQIVARLCKDCDRPDHKAKDCKQPKRPQQATPDTECHDCGELGHFRSECPKPRKVWILLNLLIRGLTGNCQWFRIRTTVLPTQWRTHQCREGLGGAFC